MLDESLRSCTHDPSYKHVNEQSQGTYFPFGIFNLVYCLLVAIQSMHMIIYPFLFFSPKKKVQEPRVSAKGANQNPQNPFYFFWCGSLLVKKQKKYIFFFTW